MKAGATGRLRSLHMMVVEKALELTVRISSEPLRLDTVTTALPVGTPRTFRLLSVPFYLLDELPHLLAAVV